MLERVNLGESDEVNVDRGRGLSGVRDENRGAKSAKGDGLPKNMREYSIVSSSYQYDFALSL